MHPGYHIREYNESDYQEIMHLWERLGLSSIQRADDKIVINRTIQLGGRLLLLTETSTGAIVGTSWLTVDGRRTYLHHFGIDTCHQGKGLANVLLSASLKLAKSFGMQVKLEVHKDNTKAIALYAKSGFTYLGDYLVFIIRDISSI